VRRVAINDPPHDCCNDDTVSSPRAATIQTIHARTCKNARGVLYYVHRTEMGIRRGRKPSVTGTQGRRESLAGGASRPYPGVLADMTSSPQGRAAGIDETTPCREPDCRCVKQSSVLNPVASPCLLGSFHLTVAGRRFPTLDVLGTLTRRRSQHNVTRWKPAGTWSLSVIRQAGSRPKPTSGNNGQYLPALV
jgi:hypothetical protein